MLYLSFKGINPQALHLAYCNYVLSRGNPSGKPPKNIYWPQHPDGVLKLRDNLSQTELSVVTRLLRWTHGVAVDFDWYRDQVEFSLFLRLCAIIHTHPLNLITLPSTFVRLDKGPIQKVSLDGMLKKCED